MLRLEGSRLRLGLKETGSTVQRSSVDAVQDSNVSESCCLKRFTVVGLSEEEAYEKAAS